MKHVALLALAAVLAGAGCRTGTPLLSRTPEDPNTPGTIAGNLQGGGGEAIAGRAIHAVREDDGRQFSVTTSVTGGFSIPVPPGKYRLKVDLLEGESLVKGPGLIDINESDLDANIEVVIGR
ncbi:MAG TPA: carboxypeptidase-like regulatory domain-containing protein [Vicinamibacteria bacterium]|nr:carboxypeptidase-like regulatory domain-containing protein [Vicinamibacteria bacterium]